MTATDWTTFKLTADPILVVGLRHASKVEGYRLVVDKNVHPALRGVADKALERLAELDAIPYTPYADPGDDEYLSLDPATLTIASVADSDGDTGQKARSSRPPGCSRSSRTPTLCRRSAPSSCSPASPTSTSWPSACT